MAHGEKDLWPESHPTRADRYADPSGVAQLTGPPTRPKVRFRTDEWDMFSLFGWGSQCSYSAASKCEAEL